MVIDKQATSDALERLYIYKDVGGVTLYGWRLGNNDDQETAETVTMLERRTTRALLLYPDIVMMMERCVYGQCLARTGE